MSHVPAEVVRNIKSVVEDSSQDYLRWLVLFISAVLSALSLYRFAYLVFLSLVFLFYALETSHYKIAFVKGFLWGIIFFTCLLWWLKYVSFLGTIVLICYLSFYPALFSSLFSKIFKRYQLSLRLAFYVTILWISLDLVRAKFLGGFPWGFLSYSLSEMRRFIQIADLAGSYSVTGIIVLFNVIIYLMIKNIKNLRRNFAYLIILLSLLFLPLLYGKIKLSKLKPAKRLVKIALVQPNIASHIKWDRNYLNSNWEKYKLLSQIAKLKGAKFLIYPETILPILWGYDFKFETKVRNFLEQLNIAILVGIPYQDNGKIYNASFLYLPEEGIVDIYYKTHLVPFGEYLPLREVLSLLKKFYPAIGNYQKGKEIKLFKIKIADKEYKFSVLICYENIFDHLWRKAVIKGAEFVVNQSDESWFQNSPEIYLHNKIAIFRAIENRRTVLRATNNGLSSIIDYSGRIIAKIEPFKAEVLLTALPIYAHISFYTLWGWIFPYLCLILSIVNISLFWVKYQ